ncbi:bifunctional glutamate/proline--tRNA ligase-like [Cotesia glomerata]|uniref:Uncharacterized protein n=1 Tax=Cotesia glomerata TaxID=32391 RepID=A0AAV7IL70_COTGL|nr:bifunctional glutamate/proline--tRNA ligase-like [Cotesia glomerata]KAH0552465.1 hypothetical protein KQX54_010470 [Cotesia glomerata]
MTTKLFVNKQLASFGAMIVAEFVSCKSSNNKIKVEYPEPWKATSNVQLLVNGHVVSDDDGNIGRYLARTLDDSLYGGTGIIENSQVDNWLSYICDPLKNSNNLTTLKELLNTSLSKNWLMTEQMTLADTYVFASLINLNYIPEP